MTINHKDLENSEKRLIKVFNTRFADHEKLEMVIYANIQKIIERHDKLLLGPNGDGGIKKDVSGIEKTLITIKTKMSMWTSIFSIVLGGGGLTVLYMIFVTP